MKRYNNIPQAIRKGIFCFMAGSMVFLASETVAEAKEGDDSSSKEVKSDDTDASAPTEDTSSDTSVEEEAGDLIDIPEEPTTSESEVTETETGTITETENTYVEETDNGVAVTEETIVEVVNDTDSMTKDEENVTVTVETTETTNDDGTVTTTETTTTTGEYIEDESSKETNSVTDIATSDKDLADEIVSQVEEAQNNNTENEGIKLEDVSEHSFIDNGQEGQDPVALTDNQAAELAGVSDGAEIVVETTDGSSTVTIDGQDVQVSDDLKDIIVDSAKDNVVEQGTTYTIGETEVSEDDISSLNPDTLDKETEFTVTKENGETNITYTDADGNTQQVDDADLKKIIDGAATTVGTKTKTENYEGLKEYENENDPDLIKEKEGLEAIGYTDVHLEDGEETYVSGSITPEVHDTKESAEAKAAELEKDKEHYTNVQVSESDETYESGSIEPEVYDTKDSADKRAAELEKDTDHYTNVQVNESDETYEIKDAVSENNLTAAEAQEKEAELGTAGYKNIKTATDEESTKTEVSSIKATIIKNGFKEDDITVTISGEGDNATYTVVAQQTLYSEEEKNNRLAALNALKSMGYSVNWELAESGSFDEHIYYNSGKKDAAVEDLVSRNYSYTVNAGSKTAAEGIKAQLMDNGFAEGEITLTRQDDGSYTITIQASYGDQTTANQKLAYLRNNGFTDKETPDAITEKEEGIDKGKCKESEMDGIKAQLEGEGYTNVKFTKVNDAVTGETEISGFDGFAVTLKSEYERIQNLKDHAIINGVMQYWEDNEDGTRTYYKLDKKGEHYTILAMTGNLKQDVNQHQEGAVFVNTEHGSENWSIWDPGLYTTVDYTVDFKAFKDKADEILKTERTAKNTIDWIKDSSNHKIDILDNGTYYIDGSASNWSGNADMQIFVARDKEVTIILYNDDKTDSSVIIPVILNDVGQISTSHGSFGGSYLPNVTFVTAAKNVLIQNVTNVGNILALNATVRYVGQGQHCGTIVCNKIDSTDTPQIAEGHINFQYGYEAYLVDERKVTKGSEAEYQVTADKETTTYNISGTKDVFTVSGKYNKYVIAVSKDATRKVVTADELAPYYVVTADKLSHKYVVTADTLAKKKHLVGERKVTKETKKATLTKTEYSKTKTTFDRTYSIKLSRYSKDKKRATWTETTSIELPPQTPVTPETPDTPVTPDVPGTPDTPTIPDVPTSSIVTTPTTPDVPIAPDEAAIPDVPSIPDVPTSSIVTTPATPDVPIAPDEAAIPDVPSIPDVPTVPDVPTTPDVPTVPDVPTTPDVPTVPGVPTTPDVPVTPDITPTPSGNPGIPGIIIDDDTPLAGEVAQVLGARRTAPQPMVLGARRAKTDDAARNPLIATLMIMGASATAAGLLSSKKKKK